MAAPRLRHSTTQREAEQARDDYMTQGYSVLSEGENTILLRKNSWGGLVGHLVVALVTAWWTFGIGNIIYAIVAHQTAEQVLIKVDLPAEQAATA